MKLGTLAGEVDWVKTDYPTTCNLVAHKNQAEKCLGNLPAGSLMLGWYNKAQSEFSSYWCESCVQKYLKSADAKVPAALKQYSTVLYPQPKKQEKSVPKTKSSSPIAMLIPYAIGEIVDISPQQLQQGTEHEDNGYVPVWHEPDKEVGWNCTGGCQAPIDEPSLFFYHKGVGDFTDFGQRTGSVWCMKCTIKIMKLDKPVMTKNGKTICLRCKEPICPVCMVCETITCPLMYKRATTPTELAALRSYLCETQKARGYARLAETRGMSVPKPFRVVMGEEDINADLITGLKTEGASLGSKNAQMFIRPCPVRPRHGFVDSRPVDITDNEKAQADIKAIFAEARVADPQAELLIVPFKKSLYNLIVTPGRVAVGPDHDGATAGHDSISIPLMGVPFGGIPPELSAQAGVGENEDPYFEVVLDEQMAVWFTQIRAGVKIPNSVGRDFIPYDLQVERVVVASGDLQEWERQAKMLTRGDVVVHVGGTLISHYGVHCIYNNIPVITSFTPKVGDRLNAVSEVKRPSIDSILTGLAAGVTLPASRQKSGKDILSSNDALYPMMLALHNAGAMSEEHGLWLGFGATVMLRYGMAASHGEARHAKTSTRRLSRTQIHEAALANFFEARSRLGQTQSLFQNNALWGGGYGGPKWAACTDAIIKLDNAILKTLTERSETSVSEMVLALNFALNQAHNNGWWMNKFVDTSSFNNAASQQVNFVAAASASMYKILKMLPTVIGRTDEILNTWKTAEPVVVANEPSKDFALWLLPENEKKAEMLAQGSMKCDTCGHLFPIGAYTAGYPCGWKGCNGTSFTNTAEPPKVAADKAEIVGPEVIGKQGKSFAEAYEAATFKPSVHFNTNVNGAIGIAENAVATGVQYKYAKASGDTYVIHVQMRFEHTEGYYSFDQYMSGSTPENHGTLKSWSGSKVSDYSLGSFVKSETIPGLWKITTDSGAEVYFSATYNVLTKEKLEVAYGPEKAKAAF